MDQQEVLVHVAAPSRLRDDERYQSLADELLRFETAAVTRVYGFVGLTSKRRDSSTLAQSRLSFYEMPMTNPMPSLRPPRLEQVAASFGVDILATASHSNESQTRRAPSVGSAARSGRPGSPFHSIIQDTPVSQAERENRPAMDDHGLPRAKGKRLGQWQVVKGQVSAEAARKRHASNNPPFRNPFHGRRPSDLGTQAFRTPELIRPRTAPAGSTGTIQVPRTLNEAHKRSASDSFLDCSLPTVSTVSKSETSARDENDQPQGILRSKRAATEPPDTSLSTDASERIPMTKRRRLTNCDKEDLIMEEAVDGNIVSDTPVEGTFEQNYQVKPPRGYKGPFFLRDRSEDWTSPPESSSSDHSSQSVSSTISPSQPLALRLSQTRISPSSAEPTPPIDLTTQSLPKSGNEMQEAEVEVLHSQSWPRSTSSPRLPSNRSRSSPESGTHHFYRAPSQANCSLRATSTRSRSSDSENATIRFTSSIRALSDRVQAPPSPIGSGAFMTHITTFLSDIVRKAPLSECFRPAYVGRDVRVLERGHWSIRVKIANDAEVAEARRPPSQNDYYAVLARQMPDAVSAQGPVRFDAWKQGSPVNSHNGLSKRCDLWTVEEFESFWKTVGGFLEAGRAGSNVSMVKDWADEALTPGRSTQSTYARVRIYTWGEVVGHMWAALWVLSDKKTAYVPMEWIGADGSVVVRMSGNRHKGGKLGPWVPKGSPGGRGSWGIEAGTPPGNQGKYMRLPNS